MKKKLLTILVVAIAGIISVPGLSAEEDASAKLDKAFKTLAAYQEGDNEGDLQYLEKQVPEAAKDPAKCQDMEQRLMAVLSGEATEAGKSQACRHLKIVGSPACVPGLAKLLSDEKLSHFARYALESISGDASTDALLAALNNAGDRQKTGIINSLGRRGDEKCVGDLVRIAGGSNEPLAVAAVQALGRIDSRKVIAAITGIQKSAKGSVKVAASDVCLDAARRYSLSGQNEKAMELYEPMFAESEPAMNRAAALLGMASLGGRNTIPRLIQEIGNQNRAIRDAAIVGLREVKGAAAIDAIAEEFPKAVPGVQSQLILVLGDRGDAAGLPVVMKALKSADAAVRIAALQAIAVIGDGSSVPVLAEFATAAKDQEQEYARTALFQMTAKGVNEAMVAEMGKAKPAVQLELVRSLGARGASEAVPCLLGTARGKDARVRVESLKQLRRLAGGKDAPELADLLLRSADGEERREAENAVVSACRQIADEGARAKPVLNAMKEAKDVPVRCAMLRVLGQVGDNRALDAVADMANDENPDLRDAAIRSMADWPNAGPMDILEKLASDASSDTHRRLAMRGYIRMIELSAERTEKEKVALYEKAMGMTTVPDDRKMALSRLGEFRTAGALRLARKYLDDEILRDSAKFAADKIEKAMSAPADVTASHNPQGAKNAIDGNLGTRWDTGMPQKGGEWFLMDLGTEKEVSGITLDCTGSNGDYPRGYEVYISNSRENFGKAVLSGKGEGAVTQIKVPPKIGRYIKIVQTGIEEGLFWSIHEIKVDARAVEQ